ncbi:MAG: ASPIC/UnbV domain-containing protein [Mariniblastus sp.]
MRDDPSKSNDFSSSDVWGEQKYEESFLVAPSDVNIDVNDRKASLKFVSNSLSGNERNRLFMRNEKNFADVSLLSGTDDLADARSHSLIDFDNDGWVDIALMSLNSPRFKIYRNEFASLFPNNQSLRIRLVGGHQGSSAIDFEKNNLSNRDAIGAKILVTYASGKTTLLQRQSGEGFGSQNSAMLHVGCSENDKILSLNVQWPSGRKSEIGSEAISQSVADKKALTIKEVQQ